MKDPLITALDYLHNRQDRFLEELQELLAIPSVSTDPERAQEVRRAARWLAEKLASLNMRDVEVFPTEKHPLVYGRLAAADPAAPTILIYGHYDVQPAEPLELWQNDPFAPEVREENLFGRGATDMKGQLMAALNAVEAALAAGAPPVSVKVLLEGEEEIGSTHLRAFIESHRDLLASTCCLNPDAGMMAPELPTITYGLRGLAYFELRIKGPGRDLHSGLFGGAVHNPAQAMCELIAGMHDPRGRVTLPGFYDPVRPLDPAERDELARLPVGDSDYLRNTGVPQLWGESGYTALERAAARPTLEVNGIGSGFVGQGTKTVLPAAAVAKLSMRLVPDQDPDRVDEQLREYLREQVPPTVRWELERLAGSPPSISDRESAALRALAAAMEAVWGRKPLFRREGGSVPVVAYLQQLLGVESLLTGFSLPEDNMHAPNEKLHLPTWLRGMECLLRFLFAVAEAAGSPRQE